MSTETDATTTPEGEGSTTSTTETTTFTQADVDRIVRERLARQKSQFADYEDLKTKATEYDKIAEAQKSELDKAQERAAKAEREAAEATERAQRVLTESSIVAAAAGKLADPSDAVALIDRSAIEYGENGAPTNVAALIDALVETKPHLAAGARKVASIDQGARGGASPVDASKLMTMGDADFMAALSDPNTAKALGG
jgi:hypothetical protein